MKGDFSRDSYDEIKHYSDVLLQQGRVQLDADWNEASAIMSKRDQRAMQDVIGGCGSPNRGFQIAARMMLDTMESKDGWEVDVGTACICVDYVDYLRGTGSLRISGATEIHKDFAETIDLSSEEDALAFAVKSAKPPPPPGGTQNDDGFTFYIADDTGKKASWVVAGLTAQTVGIWQVYTCPLDSATKEAFMSEKKVQTIGFENLKSDWTYHFDSIQRNFASQEVPLQDVLALDDIEDISGWSVPAPGTGSVGLDGSMLYEDRPTVKITGPGDGFKRFVEPRDLRIYNRIVTVTTKTTNPKFFLETDGGVKISLTSVTKSGTVGDWTTHVGNIPDHPDLDQIVGYGFENLASGVSLNVAQVLAVLESSSNFYILGGDAKRPGRLYVDGIPCQKESTETYYNQNDYPQPLSIEPSDDRVDLIYVDVWQRHMTYIEDRELREVALGGPDTCTRLRTVAQVKVLRGVADTTTDRLDCASVPQALMQKFDKLHPTGNGTLSTLVTLPAPPEDPCVISPESDYLGLDNRFYRVEIHTPGDVGTATFKWSKDNGSIAMAVVEDVEADQTPQRVKVERLGWDRATMVVEGDWVEIADDLSDLSDSGYDVDGVPLRRTGELRQVSEVDPDANEITLSSPLTRGYTVARHAKVRKWDGTGTTAAFVDTVTTPQLDFGDGVRVTFDGTEPMQTADFWQFTARGIIGQIEKLDHAVPAGVVHQFCPLALIKWKEIASNQFEIVDVADCRNHFPPLTDIQATDVAYDDGCCGLTEDVQTLADWHGDIVEGEVTNVQQAIDMLCAREHEYLTLRYVSGDGQEGLPGETLPAELIVAVENALGEAQANIPVEFTVSAGGGSVSATSVTTDSNGEARTIWTLGATGGLNLVRAGLVTPQTGDPEIIFNARVLCADKICFHDTPCDLSEDAVALGSGVSVDTVQEAIDLLCERDDKFLALRYVSGDGQEGRPDHPLDAELIVAVENLLGEPQADTAVLFAVVQGGGSVSASSVLTDPNGEAKVIWTMGSTVGLNLLKATLDTPQAGEPEIIFNARAVLPIETGKGLCTITVGDGVISQGQFNGYSGLLEALKLASDQGGGTICILRGNYLIEETIVVSDASNLIIRGNRRETHLQADTGVWPFRFENCAGVELYDLIVVGITPTAIGEYSGLVHFKNCEAIVVMNCMIGGGVNGQSDLACLFVEDNNVPMVLPSAVIQNNTFITLGKGKMSGVALYNAPEAVVRENLIKIISEDGSYGIDLERDSDRCLLIENMIHGVSPNAEQETNGSLGGIHIGSGCDRVIVRENTIQNGAGYGIGLGSVAATTNFSLGALGYVTIEKNIIQGMALTGIGVLGFTWEPGVAGGELVPATNDILIRANRVAACAYGRAQQHKSDVYKYPLFLGGGIVLWAGEDIRLLDNEVIQNGIIGKMIHAPHPVVGILVPSAGPGLAVLRNQVINNYSSVEEPPESTLAYKGGVIIRSTEPAGNKLLAIRENDMIVPDGTALLVEIPDGQVQVVDNRIQGRNEYRVVNMWCNEAETQFHDNQVISELVADNVPNAVAITTQSATVNGNHFLCSIQLPTTEHVLINSNRSAIATGNHCLEFKQTEGGFRSLHLNASEKDSLVAVGNITTNGVRVTPPSPSAEVANLQGIVG